MKQRCHSFFVKNFHLVGLGRDRCFCYLVLISLRLHTSHMLHACIKKYLTGAKNKLRDTSFKNISDFVVVS